MIGDNPKAPDLGDTSMRVLEFYTSNFDDDKDIAEELLKVSTAVRPLAANMESAALRCSE